MIHVTTVDSGSQMQVNMTGLPLSATDRLKIAATLKARRDVRDAYPSNEGWLRVYPKFAGLTGVKRENAIKNLQRKISDTIQHKLDENQKALAQQHENELVSS